MADARSASGQRDLGALPGKALHPADRARIDRSQCEHEKPGAEFLPPDDKGRFEVTKSVSDEYVFKVPTLRNVALTPPYFHTGKSWDLRQAVAVMGASQLGIELTKDEVERITAFMHALTGEQPEVTYPILPPSVATTRGRTPDGNRCLDRRSGGFGRRRRQKGTF